MSEKEITIHLDLDGTSVALTVVRATARIAAQRGYLLRTISEKIDKDPDFPEHLKLLNAVVYPMVISATSKVEGMNWPMEFEEFLDLPEEFTDDWLDAIYKCNPHWSPLNNTKDQGEPDPKNSKSHKKH